MKTNRGVSVQVVKFADGERFPLILDPANMPLWHPNLYLLLQVRNAGRAPNTTRQVAHIEWSWAEPLTPNRVVDLQLVRADVRVESSTSGQLEVYAIAQGDPSHAEAVLLKTEVTEGGISLVDQYPARSVRLAPRECLPPAGDRGDYWTYQTRLRLTLRVPIGASVTGVIMSGGIHDARRPPM